MSLLSIASYAFRVLIVVLIYVCKGVFHVVEPLFGIVLCFFISVLHQPSSEVCNGLGLSSNNVVINVYTTG